MSFSYTDLQLNYLNQDKAVYSVNSEYVARNIESNSDLKIITASPKKPIETNKINTPDGQQFQVIATKVDKETGFDGMAVAPVVNGVPDMNSVAVVVAATDSGSKDLKIPINIEPLGLKTTVEASRDLIGAGIARVPKFSSPQYFVLDKWIDDLQTEKNYNIVQLSGYSQSSFVLKAGAKYHIPTTTFNAWFHYNSLSVEEQEFIKNNSEIFIDYRNRYDFVVSLNDFNNPYDYGYDDSFGTIYWQDYPINKIGNSISHSIEDWSSYDPKTGSVLNAKTGELLVKAPVDTLKSNFLKIKALSTILSNSGSQGVAGGTGSTGSGEIFLDAGQGYVLGSSMAEAAKSGLDEMTALKTKADAEVKELMTKARSHFSSYSELSPWEVQDIFASCGVSDQMVTDFQTYTEGKVKSMSDLSSQFDGLKSSIDTLIETTIATDNKLGGEFRSWQATL